MQISPWEIVYFENDRGDSPIFSFVNGLSPIDQAKVANTLDLLAEYGTRLGSPHVKKLQGTKLWELRILGKNNIRILYITHTETKFVLLHGFLKKSQKTTPKELKTALHRLAILTNSQLKL